MLHCDNTIFGGPRFRTSPTLHAPRLDHRGVFIVNRVTGGVTRGRHRDSVGLLRGNGCLCTRVTDRDCQRDFSRWQETRLNRNNKSRIPYSVYRSIPCYYTRYVNDSRYNIQWYYSFGSWDVTRLDWRGMGSGVWTLMDKRGLSLWWRRLQKILMVSDRSQSNY